MAMFNDSFTGTVRDALEAQADAERAKSMAAYMKSYMPYRGVPKPQVRKIMMTAARAYPFADAADLLSTATKLWREANCREERYI
ncbi:DNA alkylation repair protein, partial [Vibrio vulnificus]